MVMANAKPRRKPARKKVAAPKKPARQTGNDYPLDGLGGGKLRDRGKKR